MTIIAPNVLHDSGRVNTDGTRLAGCQRGSPARTGAGAYTYTYQAGSGLDSTESADFVSVNTAALVAQIVHTSDTVLTVTSATDAGVATDSIWSFLSLALPS